MDQTDNCLDIREWHSSQDMLEKIPLKIRTNIFSSFFVDLTCISAVDNIIALGTNQGVVFLYDRHQGTVTNLQCDKPSLKLTCIQLVSSVEFQLAVGDTAGMVTIFQIHKEPPKESELFLALQKPNKKFKVNLHSAPIKCVEWSRNGMKLFSADSSGTVVLTEFNSVQQVVKSFIILNETYDVIQLSFRQSYLLVSTVFRTTVCSCGQDGVWGAHQVGTKDRKVLCSAGGTFLSNFNPVKLVSSRPGQRLWLSNVTGNVEHTLLFKEQNSKDIPEINLLNPTTRNHHKLLPSGTFEWLHPYKSDYVITAVENTLVVLNLEKVKIETVSTRLRRILDIAVNNDEIFVLEGPRSILRLAPRSESLLYLRSPQPSASHQRVESTEECFDLSPEQPRSRQFGDVFDNYVKFERIKLRKTVKTQSTESGGIVEIGQLVEADEKDDGDKHK